MRRFSVYTAAALLFLAANTAFAQDELLGTWEMADEGEIYLYHFRDDGIVFENNYFGGDLDRVSVYPYTVEDGSVSFGLGLSWFVVGVGDLDFFGDEDVQVSDELLRDVLETVTIYLLADQLGVDLEELDLQEDADLDEVIFEIYTYLIIVELEEILEIDIDDELDLTLDEGGFDELLDSVVEALGLPAEDVESADFGEVEEATAGLGEAVSFLVEQIDTLGKSVFVRSDRAVVVPPGSHTLPNGITAIEAHSWGQVKKAFSR